MQHKILVADDEAENVKILAALLKEAGYGVLVAENGFEAVKLAFSKLPSLIIMDMYLQGLDGLEVCKRLKTDALTASVPIIIITTNTAVEDIEKALSLGINAYITKPVPNKDILTAVVNILKA